MDVQRPNMFCREMQLNKHHFYAKDLGENWVSKHLKREWKDVWDLVGFCSYIYPNCTDKEKFVLIVKITLWLFFLDDYLDGKPDQFRHWLKVIEAQKAATDHYLEIMFEEVITELLGQSLTYNQKLRIMLGLVKFIQSNEISGNIRKSGMKITLNEFIDLRYMDSTFDIMYVFVEWYLDLDLDTMCNIRLFQKFNQRIADCTLLINDIYSYKKELTTENNMNYSYMSILRQTSNINFEESLKISVEMVGNLEKEIESIIKDLQLLSHKAPKVYIDECLNIKDGNHFWSKTCLRYNMLTK